MPDVTDVGLEQAWQKGNNNSVRRNSEQMNKTEKEHTASAQHNKTYPTFSVLSQNINTNQDAEFEYRLKEHNSSTDFQSKEKINCDDLTYMSGPCTEASIINALRLLFMKNSFQVYLKRNNNKIISSLFYRPG
jgi:hypothetical protein